MGRVLLLAAMLLLTGCNAFKGDKGDKGDNAMISSKTITGTPTANPHYVYASPYIKDLSTQVIDVYIVDGDDNAKLPISGIDISHVYFINLERSRFEIATYWSSGTPPKALSFPDGTQNTYRIEIKTFSSAPAKAAYLSQGRLDNSSRNALVYGRSIIRE